MFNEINSFWIFALLSSFSLIKQLVEIKGHKILVLSNVHSSNTPKEILCGSIIQSTCLLCFKGFKRQSSTRKTG